jgi:hypothetical protein
LVADAGVRAIDCGRGPVIAFNAIPRNWHFKSGIGQGSMSTLLDRFRAAY